MNVTINSKFRRIKIDVIIICPIYLCVFQVICFIPKSIDISPLSCYMTRNLSVLICCEKMNTIHASNSYMAICNDLIWSSGCRIYLFIYLFMYLLTYSMLQSPSWEANWFAASREIPRISRNPNVHYRTHKRPPPVSILGQANPVHIPTSHLLEIHPNIIHPSTPRSP